MDELKANESGRARHETVTERTSDRELVVTRTFDGPARMVFAAWTKPELMMRWWAPASFGIKLVSCEIDARTGGGYRFAFEVPGMDEPMAFFGKYLEVVPNEKMVWTNAESADGSITTLTLTEKDGKTLLTIHDLYPSKAALDEALADGSTGAYPEQFAVLDEVLAGV
jgi:uncharacterized protein YndB with AHSA1/START domain